MHKNKHNTVTQIVAESRADLVRLQVLFAAMERAGRPERVWAPDLIEGYCIGVIEDFGADSLTVRLLERSGQCVEAPYSDVYPAVEEGAADVHDNCALTYLNGATLLHNLRVRYHKDHIYTYVANILIVVNPYHAIPSLYTSGKIIQYKGKSLGVLPPHVFAIADKVYRDMRALRQSQSIIISGESGAGKTESTKHVLQYLTKSYGVATGVIEQRIVEANPLMESFGNARTHQNMNSSRFGKFVEIHFNSNFSVVGGHISHYLLERSRVCSQQSHERNYHVFYRLLAGASQQLKRDLGLDSVTVFKYLSSTTATDPAMNDKEEFQLLNHSMDSIGLSSQEKADLFRVVAVVLHLGNIEFEEDVKNKKGGCVITTASEQTLVGVAGLLGVEVEDLRQSLTSRVMTTTKKGTVGTVINIPLRPDQASSARDALAKALYTHAFDWIITRVNKCFPFSSSSHYIGVLDIAGFEYYQVNSFEQFCINYCNEKLQQLFNLRILREEQDLYKREGLGVSEVIFVDNQDCIDLIEAKGSGIIDLLDEECRLPKGSNEHFTTAVLSKHSKHFRISLPRNSKLSQHRTLRDDQGFLIRHFAGAVCYKTFGFLDKNNDSLHSSLEQLLAVSKDSFVKKALFPEVSPLAPANNGGFARKLTLDSVSDKFRTQLTMLMTKLQNTGTSFIRCIKPNQEMKPSKFIGGPVLSQLHSAGMMSVLELMQGGFPSRAQFSSLYSMYKSHLPRKLAELDPRTFCQFLFRAVGMREGDFIFGQNKVFFRPGKFAEFDQVMRGDPDNLSAMVLRVQKWLVTKRWRKAIYGAICVQKLVRKIKYRNENAVVVQASIRQFLAANRHRPRYRGLCHLKQLYKRTEELTVVVQGLKIDQSKLAQQVLEIQQSITLQQKRIRSVVSTKQDIEERYNELLQKFEDFLKELQCRQEQQKVEEEEMIKMKKMREEERRQRVEEAARLHKMQEEMNKEKLEREIAKQQEETDKKKRAEIVARQKSMVGINSKEHTRENGVLEAAKGVKSMLEVEQEKRDFELALRLAQSESQSQSMIEEVSKKTKEQEKLKAAGVAASKALKRSSVRSESEQTYMAVRRGLRHDLSKWRYAELRDAINTSCDVDLLNECHEEMRRRMKVYKNWKTKNKPQVADQKSHLPLSGGNQAASISVPGDEQLQRYFRVPFLAPSQEQLDQKRGWWYAHFDGEWIVRQLELHPTNPPLILVAGQHDMDMCELSLEETGLTRKKGAEILEQEFEQAWAKHGGSPYTPPSQRPATRKPATK